MWAAGNVTDLLAGAPAAAASGTQAAVAINMDLIGADARAADTARACGVFSGATEAEVSRRVLGDRRHGLDSLLHPRPGSGRESGPETRTSAGAGPGSGLPGRH